MPNYTANYQLHQWLPEDNFLRTDFNADFAKIDAALQANAAASAASDARAQHALDSLEPLSYNLYNLMLQNYYDGKRTGHKKALLFDGFSDSSQISSLSGGMTRLASEKCLYLDGVGQSSVSGSYGTSSQTRIQPGGTCNSTWTPTGDGQLTAIAYYTGTGSYDVQIYQGGTLLATSGEVVVAESAPVPANKTAHFQSPVTVRAGVTYELRFHNRSNAASLVLYLGSGSPHGYLYITPIHNTQGMLTTTLRDPQVSWSGAAVWVRHTAAISLTAELYTGSGWTGMTAAGSRSVQELNGASCQESAFTWSGTAAARRNTGLRLSVQIGTSTRFKLYDYGVMLLDT